MSKSEVLARIDADLAVGHTYPALQRLASLTVAYPDDMQVRARRAAVYRQVGNLVEAGRWGYLTEQVAPAEIAAFERAYWPAWARLRSLKLASDPERS